MRSYLFVRSPLSRNPGSASLSKVSFENSKLNIYRLIICTRFLKQKQTANPQLNETPHVISWVCFQGSPSKPGLD